MSEEHKDFLNRLRDSGIVNMFAASPYLVDKFGIEADEASKILVEWMESF